MRDKVVEWLQEAVDFFKAHVGRLHWSKEKLALYDKNLAALRSISERYKNATGATGRELYRLAAVVVDRWQASGESPTSIVQHSESATK